MSNLGEFGSLLQLGVGFGVGLSLFRAPLTLLLRKLDEDIAKEMDVLGTVQSLEAKRIKADLSDLKMDIATNTETLNWLTLPFMIAALVGAAVNWLVLIYASFFAQNVLTSTDEWLLVLVSVGWFLLIGCAVGLAALLLLLPLSKRLHAIRARV
jgi:hypothetical protein